MAFTIEEVEPMFTAVITTATRYVGNVVSASGIVLPNQMDGQINPYQTVIAAGPNASGLKKGDVVHINFYRYAVAKHTPGDIDADKKVQSDNMTMQYAIPMVPIGDQEYLLLQNNDIDYKVTKYSGVDEGGLLQ